MLKKLKYPLSKTNSNINIEALNEQFEYVCVFDSNPDTNDKKNISLSKLIAIDANSKITCTDRKNAFEQLQLFCDLNKGWLFGYLTYELKNSTEELSSKNTDGLAFPLLHFFSPKVVIEIDELNCYVHFDDEFITKNEAEAIYSLATGETESLNATVPPPVSIKPAISKDAYIDSVYKLKDHIRNGDIYEINFCQEFFAENAYIDTCNVYKKLNSISSAPFSAFCKFEHHYLLCASPERFLQKRSNRLISQPIKGTIKRSENKQEDEALKSELRNNLKEQSENVMIVDLVRNDLSRIAKRGSVNVEELFGIYSFKQLNQMISTVSCELKEGISFTDVLRSTFPMGSMTGAPKVSAMRLIEQYESTKRGLYSGAVGYIHPNGDFDFNVVIRSILYNSKNKYVSFMAGSAITDKADPEQEYKECLLKAKAMFEVLGNTI